MSRIRIVTDSTARFPIRGFLERYSISVVPLSIRLGKSAFAESDTIKQEEHDGLFSSRDILPYAEAPTIEAFAEVYNELKEDTDRIVSIHTSSQILPVVANAYAASQRFLGRCNIQVIDSQSISVGLGLLVQTAAEAVADGKDFETVVRIMRGMIPRLYLIFSVDDLIYLEHNGLISRSQAILGNMLGIIALLTIEDGKIIPMEKVRTRIRSIEKMVEFASEFTSVDHISILHSHGQSMDECRTLKDRLHLLYRDIPITVAEYGTSVASFIGPKSTGVVVLESEEG